MTSSQYQRQRTPRCSPSQPKLQVSQWFGRVRSVFPPEWHGMDALAQRDIGIFGSIGQSLIQRNLIEGHLRLAGSYYLFVLYGGVSEMKLRLHGIL